MRTRVTPRRSGSVAAFFRSRWHGRVAPARVLWTDMLLHGTAINVAAALLGLFLFASRAPTALAAVCYFLPLPYNAFLAAALWKSAAGAGEPRASVYRAVGLLWLVAVTVV